MRDLLEPADAGSGDREVVGSGQLALGSERVDSGQWTVDGEQKPAGSASPPPTIHSPPLTAHLPTAHCPLCFSTKSPSGTGRSSV